MKLVLVLTVFLVALAGARAGRFSHSNEVGPRQTPAQYFVSGVNATVQAILKSLSTAAGSVYVWDLLPLTARFVALNQTRVQQLPYNITNEFLNNNTNLSWATLPANVRALLLSEKANNEFVNLTFAELGLVDSSNAYATYTIFQLLSSSCQAILPNVTALLSQVSFDNQINATAFIQSLYQLSPYYGFSFSGRRGFRTLLGHAFDSPSRSQTQLTRLYNYLNNASANSRCHLQIPLRVLGEIAEFCFNPPRRWRW